jgi:hypothetical protein
MGCPRSLGAIAAKAAFRRGFFLNFAVQEEQQVCRKVIVRATARRCASNKDIGGK